MSNLRNILGRASEAFRNATVVCEENKTDVLRMSKNRIFECVCFGNFGFLLRTD